MRRVRSPRVPRLLASAVALAVALLGLGLDATPASALNHDTYNILKNAGLHQYCLDIRTEDGTTAQLWTCTHPVVGEQLFILVSDQFGHDHIKVKRNGLCLMDFQHTFGFPPPEIHATHCDFDSRFQSWDLRDTGEIVTVGPDPLCLEPVQDDTKGTHIHASRCDDSISQRWFF